MSAHLPFRVTPEAEDYLRTRNVPPGTKARLTAANRFEMTNAEGELTDRYEGLHFTIGYDKPDDRTGLRVVFGSNEFWIPHSTVAELRGKTLELMKRYEGEKQPGKIQNLLVAV